MKSKTSKTAAASASGKPGTKNSKPAAAPKGGKAKAAADAAAAKGETTTPPADAATDPSASATAAASAPGTAGTATTPAPGTDATAGTPVVTDAAAPAPGTIDPNGINPATGNKWTVRELKAEMAKNAAIIQKGAKPPQGVVVEEPVKPVVLSARPVADITKDWIVETPHNGLGFSVKEGMPVEEWAALVRSLDRQHENIGFAIGDLLNYGAKAYGKTYDEALKATGRSIKTLRNWKNIASSIAPEVRKVDVLSFGIHEAVAALPAAKQTEILEKAEKESLSVREVRKLAKEAKPKKAKKKGTTPPPPAGTTTPKPTLTDAEEKLWEKAQENLDKAATFVRGAIWKKLTKVDKNSVKSVLKMLADAYQEVVNG